MPTKYLEDMQLFFKELGINSKPHKETDSLSEIFSFTAVIFTPEKPVF